MGNSNFMMLLTPSNRSWTAIDTAFLPSTHAETHFRPRLAASVRIAATISLYRPCSRNCGAVQAVPMNASPSQDLPNSQRGDLAFHPGKGYELVSLRSPYVAVVGIGEFAGSGRGGCEELIVTQVEAGFGDGVHDFCSPTVSCCEEREAMTSLAMARYSDHCSPLVIVDK